jgi:hypothetical protein
MVVAMVLSLMKRLQATGRRIKEFRSVNERCFQRENWAARTFFAWVCCPGA